MAKAGQMRGSTPRITAKAFAQMVGTTEAAVRDYMAMAKSYRDAARKWAKRSGYSGEIAKPVSITALSRSMNPRGFFQNAFANLAQKLEEGVSNLLNTKAKRYVENIAIAMAKSPQFLLDDRMQKFVEKVTSGEIDEMAVFRMTGGKPLKEVFGATGETETKTGEPDSVAGGSPAGGFDFSDFLDDLEQGGIL